MWISVHIDPSAWYIRCRKCSAIFTAGDMLKAYAEKQKDTPYGLYFVKCPGCQKEDLLTDPSLLPIGKNIESLKRRVDS